MTSWTVSLRADAVDSIRDSSMYWEDVNSASTDDPTTDFFGQFVDLDATGSAATFATDDLNTVATGIPGMAESHLLMGDHGTGIDGPASSAVSSGDEFDFLSSSSHIDAAVSAASHDINPLELTFSADNLLTQSSHHLHQQQQQQQQQHHHHHHQFEYLGRASMSEADLSRLEGITLHSPQKPAKEAASDPSSPTPPNTDVRKPKKFVDALSSTIKKAKKLRKNKKMASEMERPSSPVQEASHSIRIPKQRAGKVRAVTQGNFSLPVSPPVQQLDQGRSRFVHGQFEDPFRESGLLPPQGINLQYYAQVAPDTPVESPGVKSEPGQNQFQAEPAWPQHQHQHQHQHQQGQQHLQWTGTGGEYVTSQEGGWWTSSMMSHHDPAAYAPNHHHHHHHQQQQQHQRSASVHTMGHGQQHSNMAYDYGSVSDTSTGGLMIHMPQPRGSQSTVVNDLTVNAQMYLPPPPPIPQTGGPVMPATERLHRPPKAKSSGARHLSCSPVRKQRGPSASPTAGDQSAVPRSRHSSGASVSSVRSASGRLPGSMPGTPCSVRKRRSRDVSGPGGGGGGGGISLGGDSGIGFVNFTPSDGGVLMTGVAPSGSSKTKARREKEAQERRRRLSEAAIKAVAAAGGDVDKLIEQGFAF